MKKFSKRILVAILSVATLVFGGVAIGSALGNTVANAATSATVTASAVSSHTATATSGMYFKATANAAPYAGDWGLRYKPTSADAVTLTRNGETTNVGNTGAETLVKYSETEYFIESWAVGVNGNGWQVGDIYTLNGSFYNATNDATITFENVTLYIVSVTDGKPSVVADPFYQAGKMYAHENGVNLNEYEGNGFGFYFRTDANGAAYASDWSKEYGATSVDNIKLTRNGVTTSVAVVGQGTIVRLNEVDHYMKFVPWTTSGVLPVQEGDIFTISGAFKCTSDATQMFTITETTVTYVNGALKYSTDPVVYEAGQMYAHENGVNLNEYEGNGFGFYFRTDANGAAYASDWSKEYGATSVDNIKLTRGDVTTSVAVVGQGTIVRLNEVDHYMKFVPWTTSGVLPVQEGDIFTISGTFKCTSDATQMFTITETTVTYTNGALQYSTDPVVYEAGQMYTHSTGIGNNTESEFAFYFKTDANDAAYASDWSKEYGATSVDNIKLTRNGETTSVAVVGQGTIVRLNEIDHYMKFAPWTTSGVLPVQEGDIFTISGTFKCTSDATQMFNITETTVTYKNGALQYSTDPTVYNVGQMYAHTGGAVVSGNGGWAIHFMTDENDAPFNADWSMEYQATTVDNVKLTRSGATTSVANLGQGLIVKFGENEYCFKAEAWTLSCGRDFVDGDVLTIGGQFTHPASNAIINITETTLTYENGRFAFSTDPVVYEAGKMSAHENGVNLNENEGNGFGFHFRTDANDAKHSGYDGDEDGWDVEYGATSVDNIKLTRNGVTTSVAVVGQGTIVKLNETDHYMKFVPWTTTGVLPVQEGDIFTISGTFKCTSDAT